MSTRLPVPELLGRDVFAVDEGSPHIVLDPAVCATCTTTPCVAACPAQLYRMGPDGVVGLDHAGCLECGTCRVVCEAGGIVRWTYPRSTFGVSYRQG